MEGTSIRYEPQLKQPAICSSHLNRDTLIGFNVWKMKVIVRSYFKTFFEANQTSQMQAPNPEKSRTEGESRVADLPLPSNPCDHESKSKIKKKVTNPTSKRMLQVF